jgi:hypothetical protein
LEVKGGTLRGFGRGQPDGGKGKEENEKEKEGREERF